MTMIIVLTHCFEFTAARRAVSTSVFVRRHHPNYSPLQVRLFDRRFWQSQSELPAWRPPTFITTFDVIVTPTNQGTRS